jgi:cation diffusion facilitator CzcD-associated flavoprotein CzcO
LFGIKQILNDVLQVVVVVGSSLSGQDISMELVDAAKEVHLSSKSLDITEGLSKVISKHDNLHLRPQASLRSSLISKFFFCCFFYLSNTS